jgi:hypothetical protein
MLKAPRPSRIADMQAIAMPRLLKKGYSALTFFGYVITHSQQEAEAFNACHTLTTASEKGTHLSSLKNHEAIHLYQARSTHNSWLCFYWRYGIFWLKAFRYRKHLKNAGYWLNPFEMEAYENMYNLDYLKDKEEGCTGWKHYATLPLTERFRIHQHLSR